MSFAYQDIDATGIAEAVPQARRVAVVCRTAAFGAAMRSAMAAEGGEDAAWHDGALADVARDGALADADLVVFETAADDMGDLAAAEGLRTRSVAVVQGEVTPFVTAAWRGAGVDEVVRWEEIVGAPPELDAPTVLAEPEMPERITSPEPEPEPDPAPAPAKKSQAETGMGRVFAVLRSRGGAGATTVAVNLAACLAARKGRRVAILDLDIQNGTVALSLDLPDSAEVSALIREGRMPDTAFLTAAMAEHRGGVSVLAAPDALPPLTALTPAAVAALIDAARAAYDEVVVDMPLAVVDWMEPVLSRAARALIVTDTSVAGIKRTRRLIDLVTEDNMTLPVDVVVNREGKPMLLSQAQKEAVKVLGRKPAHWIPADPRAARRAMDLGVPMTKRGKGSRTAKALTAMAAAIGKEGK